MIDYEKLKIAHELAIEYGKKINKCIDVSVTLNRAFTDYPVIYSWRITGENYHKCASIDVLIAELQKHVKQELKYKIGDHVWRLSLSYLCTPIEVMIEEITCHQDECLYRDSEGYSFGDGSLFPTREDVIEHQIQYWSKLRDEVGTECQHEPDRNCVWYGQSEFQGKCIKCGEFYR